MCPNLSNVKLYKKNFFLTLEKERYIPRLLYIIISPFIASIGTCNPETYILRRAQQPLTVAWYNKCYNDRELKCWYLQGSSEERASNSSLGNLCDNTLNAGNILVSLSVWDFVTYKI